MKTYLVGGAVRDQLMGKSPKDLDFCVVAPDFGSMVAFLQGEGCEIYTSNPEFMTLKAKHPRFGVVADFAVARKDGDYSDGRRPDSVEVADIFADLSRRDFTINALARDMDTQEIIDPFDGIEDMNAGVLRCVGDTDQRFAEDSLRMLRAVRFSMRFNLKMSERIVFHLQEADQVARLSAVSRERVRDEFYKMFAGNCLAVLQMLERFPLLRDFAFNGNLGLSLLPTFKKL